MGPGAPSRDGQCATVDGWGRRFGHTTVIDAAGSIYAMGVILGGGASCCGACSDVWQSTGGANSTHNSRVKVLNGYCRGALGAMALL